jgi:hypothetical protein
MKRIWNEQKVEMPDAVPIIDASFNKLDEYRSRADLVPAYIVAMGNHSIPNSTTRKLT